MFLQESPQGRARQQSGRAETQGTYDTLKVSHLDPLAFQKSSFRQTCRLQPPCISRRHPFRRNASLARQCSLLQIGQVYPGRVGQPRGPLRDQSDSVALVRGKDGVMRQLIISDASKQQV